MSASTLRKQIRAARRELREATEVNAEFIGMGVTDVSNGPATRLRAARVNLRRLIG